jgi:hypothetical protein
MTLGERCDEIVRLINETLGDLAVTGTEAPAERISSASRSSSDPRRRQRLRSAADSGPAVSAAGAA